MGQKLLSPFLRGVFFQCTIHCACLEINPSMKSNSFIVMSCDQSLQIIVVNTRRHHGTAGSVDGSWWGFPYDRFDKQHPQSHASCRQSTPHLVPAEPARESRLWRWDMQLGGGVAVQLQQNVDVQPVKVTEQVISADNQPRLCINFSHTRYTTAISYNFFVSQTMAWGYFCQTHMHSEWIYPVNYGSGCTWSGSGFRNTGPIKRFVALGSSC